MSAQPLLFDDLPETEPARKPARRSRATSLAAPVAVDVVREAVPARDAAPALPVVAALPLAPPAPPAPPPPFDPAALSNPELRALVQAVPDQRLAYLLVEAARELKRRALPDHGDEDGAGEGAGGAGAAAPNPLLLRAARQAVGELSGEDS